MFRKLVYLEIIVREHNCTSSKRWGIIAGSDLKIQRKKSDDAYSSLVSNA